MPSAWGAKGLAVWVVLRGDATAEALGRKVDLLTENSISPLIRERIQDEVEVLYEAA